MKTLMNNLMNALMLSCTKATRLVEKQSMDGLSANENFRLAMHTAMCSACRRYQKQSLFLNKALSIHMNAPPEVFSKKNIRLGFQTRQRIQREIEDALEKL